jgi:hypothetical protein
MTRNLFDGPNGVWKEGPVVHGESFNRDVYKNLTSEEVRALPFELKVCYSIQGWNHGFFPRSVEEWANGMGWLAFKDFSGYSEETISDWRQKAFNRAEYMINYIRDVIMIPWDLDTMGIQSLTEVGQTDYIKELNKRYVPLGSKPDALTESLIESVQESLT